MSTNDLLCVLLGDVRGLQRNERVVQLFHQQQFTILTCFIEIITKIHRHQRRMKKLECRHNETQNHANK